MARLTWQLHSTTAYTPDEFKLFNQFRSLWQLHSTTEIEISVEIFLLVNFLIAPGLLHIHEL